MLLSVGSREWATVSSAVVIASGSARDLSQSHFAQQCALGRIPSAGEEIFLPLKVNNMTLILHDPLQLERIAVA